MAFHRISDPRRLHALIDAILLIEANGLPNTLLTRIVDAACELVGARYGALGVLSSDGRNLSRFITHGIDDETSAAIGPLPHGAGVLGEVIRTGESLRIDHLHGHPSAAGWPARHPPMTRFLGVPVVTGDGRIFGNLYLTDPLSGEPFSEVDQDTVEAFGRAAGLVVDQASLRSKVREATLNEERARLARELHDTVIQRLFGVGLELQLTLTGQVDEASRQRVNVALDDLDTTIREIRTTIFEIDRDAEEHHPLEARVRALTDELSARLGVNATVRVAEGIDDEIDSARARTTLAALREILANVARHAQATNVDVELVVVGRFVELRVQDDGVGFVVANGSGRGLGNLASRAHDFGGTSVIESTPGRGTLVRWSVARNE
ncbi:MAG TPA: GAF domain-containing protein [Acidimicrobiales bacterium]|nr:GAF domain-containing protein [Acidimicrobiales bacterium]